MDDTAQAAIGGEQQQQQLGNHSTIDDASMHTITATALQSQDTLQQPHDGTQAYAPPPNRPTTSYSDTGFAPRSYSQDETYSPTPEQQQTGNGISRPPSAVSAPQGRSHSDYGERGQRGSDAQKNPSVVIKVGMVGDAQIGKTSLMVKYVEGSWDEDYIQTLGVNFMEKTISIRNTEITFSIWDLGGQREFVNMLPLVCNDAVAILFMFDLTRKSTLNSIKEWYRQGRGFNKTAIPFLVGTKYDHFVNFPREEQEEISTQAKRFAKAMKASLIFSSTSHSINVQKIFKIVLSKAFDLRCTIPEIENVGEPLLLYQAV
ncbi:small GTPase [Polychaeton citri CBS 116435]|uniref:Small GTPase n=1 Tax=Polychaeton citri CBS 116435 TaxID=1314669 RepID=A0A9P4UT30_9PEZI|nr:small GTPase [Polychaeton citri CBS 116435]